MWCLLLLSVTCRDGRAEADHLCHHKHDQIAIMKLITDAVTCTLPMSSSKNKTRCHCPLFSHAGIAALKLMTDAVTCAWPMSLSKNNTRLHCPLFSHAEIAALKLITDAVICTWPMS